MSPSGFVGRQLTAELLRRGHCVHGLARSRMTIPSDWRERFSLAQADFSTPVDSLREQLRGVSAVVHCAGHYQAEQADLETYVRSVANLCEAAGQAGARHVVLLSSVAVYGDKVSGRVAVDEVPVPSSAYGRSRLDAEAQAAAILDGSGVRLTIVRIPAVVGVGMRGQVLARFFRGLRFGVFLHPGPAGAFLPCVGVQRLAAALALLVEHPSPDLPPVIQLSDAVSWTDLASNFGERSRGRAPTRIPLPGAFVRVLARPLGPRVAAPLRALANTTGYEDLGSTLQQVEPLPGTWQDLKAVIADHVAGS